MREWDRREKEILTQHLRSHSGAAFFFFAPINLSRREHRDAVAVAGAIVNDIVVALLTHILETQIVPADVCAYM